LYALTPRIRDAPQLLGVNTKGGLMEKDGTEKALRARDFVFCASFADAGYITLTIPCTLIIGWKVRLGLNFESSEQKGHHVLTAMAAMAGEAPRIVQVLMEYLVRCIHQQPCHRYDG
jgi:hypothetical protein